MESPLWPEHPLVLQTKRGKRRGARADGVISVVSIIELRHRDSQMVEYSATRLYQFSQGDGFANLRTERQRSERR